MIRVYSAPTLPLVANLKNVFDANGISSVIRNEFSKSGVGELPPTECWPELWIVDDADIERARKIVAEATAGPKPTALPWRCRHCGEEVDAVFAECWSCGTER